MSMISTICMKTGYGNIVPKYAYTPYKEYLKWVSENLYKGYMVKRPGAASWDKEYQAMSATNKYGIYGANGGGYLSLNSDTYRVYPPQNILLSTDEEARFVIGPMFRGRKASWWTLPITSIRMEPVLTVCKW